MANVVTSRTVMYIIKEKDARESVGFFERKGYTATFDGLQIDPLTNTEKYRVTATKTAPHHKDVG